MRPRRDFQLVGILPPKEVPEEKILQSMKINSQNSLFKTEKINKRCPICFEEETIEYEVPLGLVSAEKIGKEKYEIFIKRIWNDELSNSKIAPLTKDFTFRQLLIPLCMDCFFKCSEEVTVAEKQAQKLRKEKFDKKIYKKREKFKLSMGKRILAENLQKKYTRSQKKIFGFTQESKGGTGRSQKTKSLRTSIWKGETQNIGNRYSSNKLNSFKEKSMEKSNPSLSLLKKIQKRINEHSRETPNSEKSDQKSLNLNSTQNLNLNHQKITSPKSTKLAELTLSCKTIRRQKRMVEALICQPKGRNFGNLNFIREKT